MVLAILLNLAFWGGLVLLIVGAVKQFRPGPGQAPRPDDADDPAMRILEERFARGEIDAEEFQRRREVLRGARPH
jgi:putative membrane protein